MQAAFELAEKARLLSPPNPWVGCTIVQEGQIVGRGFTQPPGSAHAEIVALREAQTKAEGATVYVTLEPCSHWGRTPPCVDALIAAKVKKIVVAIEDPDPLVKGQGIQRLRQAGIEVIVGECSEQAMQLLEPYIFHRTHRCSFCVLKSGVSMDGRIAAQDRSSQWITSEEAREDVQRLRAQSQAILVGAGTANTDKPKLTVRHPSYTPLKPPLRVVCAGKSNLEPDGPLFDMTLGPTLIYATEQSPPQNIETWQATGAEVKLIGSHNGNIDLKALLQDLATRGVLQVLVEGGPTLQASFIQAKLAQKWVVYVGNCLLGNTGLPLLSDFIVKTIKDAPRFILDSCQQFADSVKLIYSPNL